MAASNEEQWKELYMMVVNLKGDLQETQRVIKQYNAIREDLNWCVKQITKREKIAQGRSMVYDGIREWGGWLVAIGILLLKIFG